MRSWSIASSIEARVGRRLGRGRRRELDVAVLTSALVLIEPGSDRVEVSSAAICEREPAGIEEGDVPGRRAPRGDPPPRSSRA